MKPSSGRNSKSSLSSESTMSSHFLSAMASLEGRPRFLHSSDQRDLDANIASLVSDEQLELPKNVLKSDTRPKEDEEKPKKSKKLRKQSLKLSSSLTMPASQRQHRSSLYNRVNDELGGKWQQLVHSRRAAPQLFFPLRPLKDPKTKESRFQPETPLELEVARLLSGSKAEAKEEKEQQKGLSKREQAQLARITMAEALAKHSDVARLRALQSYVSVKLKRAKRIKSRKYRRVVRNAKLKEREANNDNEDEDVDSKIERTRIRERATLRHRNTSAFLKMQARRKKDPEAREAVQEQLRLHRDLMTKPEAAEEPEAKKDEDSDADLDEDEDVEIDTDNPWMKKVDEQETKESVADFEANVVAFIKDNRKNEGKKERKEKVAQENNDKKNVDEIFSAIDNEDDEEDSSEESDGDSSEKEEKEDISDDTKTNSKKQKESNETTAKQNVVVQKPPIPSSQSTTSSKEYKALEPDAFVSTKSLSRLPTLEEDVEDDIMEAFADDDVAADFVNEKNAREKDTEEKEDVLKGWGEWAGPGCKSRRRRRRTEPFFSLSLNKKNNLPRRDAKKPSLILNDDKDTSLSKHQVKSVPFPFTSVKDFEASVRAPIGETFVPRTAFKELTKPKIVTKPGRIIEPMAGEELIKRNVIDVIVDDNDDDNVF